MQLRARALYLAVSASVAVSVSAQAQDASATTPPAAATAPATPPDAATTSTNAAADTGVAGGPSADRKAAGEDIVVTGSRVRRKDLTTPAPVTVISREQIVSSGIASIGDFLQQIPEQGGALNTNVNNGGDGETAISLRNLGASRTLVLVDGKRWVNGGSGAGSFVDLNSVPTAAIERVEVLKDGASAVYGSDAIGGVVNIITRRRVNGVEAQAYGGESPHGDAQQYDLSITGGATSDKGSFMFNAEYFNQQAMFAGARDWAKSAVTLNYVTGAVTTGGSGTIPSGRATVDLNACNGNALCSKLNTAFSTALKCKPGASCPIGFRPDTTSPQCAGDGTTSVGPAGTDLTKCNVDGWRPVVSAGANNDLYNFQAVNYLVTPSTRMSLFSNGDFHISNSARAYFQGSYLNRQSGVQLASEPLSTGAFGVQLPIDNAFNPFGNASNAACVPDADGNPPPGCGQAVSAARRLTDAGGRTTAFDLNTIRAVVGMDGTLPEEFGPLQGLFWDVSFNYGRTQGTTTFGGSVNTLATANALGPTSGTGANLQCGAANSPISGCSPANLFGGPLTPAMLNSLGFYTGINSGFTQLASTQANISAELFKLAADRPIGLAAGYEYRAEYGGFQPDPIGAAQESFDFNSFPTKGSYHVNEGYAELDIPVISNVPGAEDLEIQAALRVFNYNTFGTDATYKLGARWRPIRDVTVRGTYSTGFRAPDVSSLFGGAAPSAEVASDPCGPTTLSPTSTAGARCLQFGPTQGVTRPRSGDGLNKALGNGDQSVQLNSTVGGNSALQPEKAKIATIGLVVEPSMLRGLSATLDYYNIKVTEDIASITAPVILNGCYNEGNDAYCKLVSRDPTSGQISNINDFLTNVGTIQTSGFDFAVRYGFPTDFGRFGVVFDSNYLIYERQSFGDGSLLETAGNYDFGSGSPVGSLTPKIKFNVGLNYALGGFSAGLRARYIGGFDECAGTGQGAGSSAAGGFCSPDQRADVNGDVATKSGLPPVASSHVPAYVTFDLGLSYLLKTSFGNTTFSAGMRNILDKNPPFVYNETFIFTDPGYDLVGRFVYGRIAQSF
jgi:iron complex outermembrane receptor protein